MNDVWQAIGSDPKLQHARRVLSMDELRMICRHAWANPPTPNHPVNEAKALLEHLSGWLGPEYDSEAEQAIQASHAMIMRLLPASLPEEPR